MGVQTPQAKRAGAQPVYLLASHSPLITGMARLHSGRSRYEGNPLEVQACLNSDSRATPGELPSRKRRQDIARPTGPSLHLSNHVSHLSRTDIDCEVFGGEMRSRAHQTETRRVERVERVEQLSAGAWLTTVHIAKFHGIDPSLHLGHRCKSRDNAIC